MAKEEANVRDFRTFVLKNFRNFAPFCAGTEDDPDDLKEFLELNRGLTLEELGGLVILISANNCGKSNLLDALEKYQSKTISKEDYTDFTFDNRVKPSLGMNVANGVYGTFRKPKTVTVYEGPTLKVLLALALEKNAYSFYVKKLNTRGEDYYYIEEGSNTQAPAGDKRPVYEYTKVNFIDQTYEKLRKAINQPFESSHYSRTVNNVTDPYFLELYKHLKPESNNNEILPGCLESSNSSEYVDKNVKVVSEGEPLDDHIFTMNEHHTNESDSAYLKNKRNDRFKEIANVLSEVKVSYQTVYEKDASSNGAFLEKFGYELNEEIHRYTRKKIKQSDLICKPSALNQFILNLFTILGYDKTAIENAYSGAGNLRHKVEREMNKSLEKVSEELNDLLNINEKKYDLHIELERENIEFIITYGDEIPLNLDRQSEGFTWLFDLFFNLIKLQKFNPGDIILMDEFGNSLSFATIAELTKKLRDYAKKNSLTFVLATQNPMAVDIVHLDEVRLLVPNDDGSTHILNDFDQFGGSGNHDVMAPILSGLTVSRNFMRSENRKSVFVEGVTDYFYLNGVCEALRSRGKDIDLDFIPINGLGSCTDDPKKVISQIVAIERCPTIFTDSDKAGLAFKKAANVKNIDPSNVEEILGEGKKEIEDVFSKEDAKKLGIITPEGKVNKKFDHAACLSYKIPIIYDDLDEETRSNFEKIIDYIQSQ